MSSNWGPGQKPNVHRDEFEERTEIKMFLDSLANRYYDRYDPYNSGFARMFNRR